MPSNRKIPIQLPLRVPYRTGSYLIHDYDPDAKPSEPRTDCPPPLNTHFREGSTIGLRASGSRQVDAEPFAKILNTVAGRIARTGTLYVIDLRQESHLFFDGRAVSWYADRDWSNVGRSLDWILSDEASRINSSRGKTTQVFCTSQSRSDGCVTPTGYSDVAVNTAQSEKEVVNQIASKLPCAVSYQRIPVTDHCMPTMDAAKAFVDLCWKLNPNDTWLHFHCHGGDGRTTTFLAMYDMFCWARSGQQPFPSVKEFGERQMSLFCYDLNPSNPPCDENTDWKCGLANVRRGWLIAWHDWLAQGGLQDKKKLKYEP